MRPPVLSLVVCTMHDRLEAAKQVFEQLPAIADTEFRIIAQGAARDGEYLTITNEQGARIEIVTLISRGLSRNRNAAIERSRGEYVWFLDDDVSVTPADIDYLMEEIRAHGSDIYVGRIRCSDCDGDYKDYSRRRRGILGVLRVSSIEIVARRARLVEKNLRFNQQLGLGSNYPSGEENLFLVSAWRSGLDFHFCHHAIVAHPCLIEERKPRYTWRQENIVRSKGIVARGLGGWQGWALCLWWTFRAVIYNRSLRPVSWLAGGFFTDAKRVLK